MMFIIPVILYYHNASKKRRIGDNPAEFREKKKKMTSDYDYSARIGRARYGSRRTRPQPVTVRGYYACAVLSHNNILLIHIIMHGIPTTAMSNIQQWYGLYYCRSRSTISAITILNAPHTANITRARQV